MTNINYIRKNSIKAYIVIVLLTTWITTIMLFINPSIGKMDFSLIMLIPAIIAIIFNKVTSKNKNYIFKNTTLKSVFFGVLYPIYFVSICALIALIIGIGNISANGKITFGVIVGLIVKSIMGLFLTLGEEYGWRGYLLPRLTEKYDKTKATIIVGIVWGLYHVPAVFLLAKATGIGNPLFLCIVQALAVFTFSFPCSYSYYSSSSLFPVLVLHSVWNAINPLVFGNIYTNSSGLISGNVVLINGEGLLGCIVGTIMIFYFIKKFKVMIIKDKELEQK